MVKADFRLRRIFQNILFQLSQVGILTELITVVGTGRLILAPGLHDNIIPVFGFDAHAQRIVVIGMICDAIFFVSGVSIVILVGNHTRIDVLYIGLQITGVATKIVVGDHSIRLAKTLRNVLHITGQCAEVAVADQQDI